MKKIFLLVMLVVGMSCSLSQILHAGERGTSVKNQQRRIFHYLNATYPDAMKRIKQLMSTDPTKARAELKKLSAKGLVQLKKEQAEWATLIKAYKTTKSAKVLNKIKVKMVADYDRRIKYEERALENIEKGLIISKMNLKKLKANKNSVIAKKLEMLKQASIK